MARSEMSKGDVLFHPVRMRLVLALVGRQLTPRQLAELLPDVPQATLYHHLKRLTSAGMLRVVSERPVRGATEKVYALHQGTVLTQDDLQTATREQLARYFATFVAALMSDFGRYLERDQIDMLADGVGFRQIAFYATDAEFTEMVRRLSETLLPTFAQPPQPGRTRRTFTTIVMPAPEVSESPGPPSNAPERPEKS